MITRFLILGFAFIAFSCSTPSKMDTNANLELQKLEESIQGRIGVYAFNSKKVISNREHERFRMCSTFKLLLCAHVLNRVEAGKLSLDKELSVKKSDLITYSPQTKKYEGKSMSVAKLCEATVQFSDNTAANILLKELGGPTALTRFLRKSGDTKTRLDRYEPEMNKESGEMDTTTPESMAKSIQALNSKQLNTWLLGAKTGKNRLLAGLPQGWGLAHKTGTCRNSPSNDVGIIYPSDRGEPIYIAAYVSATSKSYKDRDEVLAEIARIVSKQFSRSK